MWPSVGTAGVSSGTRWMWVSSLPIQVKRSRRMGGGSSSVKPSSSQKATQSRT